MQTIATLAQNAKAHLSKPLSLVQNTQEASLDNHQKRNDPIDELFHSLAGIYGYLWTNMYKQISVWAAAKTQWRKGLREINASITEVNTALEKCRHLRNLDGSIRMVNLPEFLAFIENARKEKREKDEAFVRLPKPKIPYEQAKPHIDKI